MRGQQPSGQGVAVRKSAKRRERVTASAPMLIMRGMVSDQLEIRERMAVQAFSGGWATIREFDVLADMQGVLLLAGTTSKGRQPAAKWAKDVLGKTLGSIRDRYIKTEKMGCNAEELKVLRSFVSMHRDFWLKQPFGLYQAACKQLQVEYNRMAKE